MKLQPNVPFNPKKFPFFYGWFLLPLASLGIIMSLPGQTAGFSAFTESILSVTGISRTELSLFYMIGTIMSGFILPTMGTLVDTLGSRKMMIFASVMLGISLFSLSFFDRIALLFSATPSFFVYMVILIVGIFSLRFFGQGLLPVIANTMIGKWFVLKRGRAFAVIGVVNTLVFSAAPAILAAIVSFLGWSMTWRLLAALTGLGMSSIAFIFYRNTPEECGLLVDGEKSGFTSSRVENAAPPVFGITRSSAIRTKAFWAVIFGVGANALVITGLTFHIQAIGAQAGLSPTKAVSLFIPVSFIAVPLSFTAGMLLDRIRARYILLTLACAQLVAFCAISFLETTVGYITTICSLGVASGMMGPSQTAIIPKIFGRKYLGSLNGLVISLSVIASAIGPILLSGINDLTGSLRTGIITMCVLPLMTIFLSLGMKEKYER